MAVIASKSALRELCKLVILTLPSPDIVKPLASEADNCSVVPSGTEIEPMVAFCGRDKIKVVSDPNKVRRVNHKYFYYKKVLWQYQSLI